MTGIGYQRFPLMLHFSHLAEKNHIRADIQAKADWRCFGLVKTDNAGRKINLISEGGRSDFHIRLNFLCPLMPFAEMAAIP